MTTYVYKSTTGRTISIEDYVVTVNPGLQSTEQIEALDAFIGSSISRYDDGVLTSADTIAIANLALDSSGNVTGLVGPKNETLTLSEVTAYVNMTSTGLAYPGVCELAGYICTVAAGTITVYDGTNASGTVIVPTQTLSVGSFPVFGAGTTGKLALNDGCYVVLSGAATINVMVQ